MQTRMRHFAGLMTLVLALFALALPAQAADTRPGQNFDHMRTGFPLTGAHAQIECQDCHVRGAFKGTPSQCQLCHVQGGRVAASSKPASHVPTNDRSDLCHTSTVTWVGDRFTHGGVNPGDCWPCHNGRTATGKSANHVQTTASCDSCHRMTAWLPAGFNHAGIAPSGYGLDAQLQLPRGESRKALGYDMVFQGMEVEKDGKDHAIIAVNAPERKFTANAKFYWSEYNQGYMKKPHIERFWTHDIYISPLEMVGGRDEGGVWFEPGETKQAGNMKITFQGFMPETGEGRMKLTALIVADMGGRTVPLKPTFEVNMADGKRTSTPAYLSSGGTISILSGDPQ